MNLLTKTTDLAMYLCLAYVEEGDTVIDATCGNGSDCLALSKAVGPSGKVVAFDIQNQAIENTKKLLSDNGCLNAKVILDSFEHMQRYFSFECEQENEHAQKGAVLIETRPSACVFNLGYLPSGDKGITTEADTSLLGVKVALELIKTGGVVVITMYQGHEAGKHEKDVLLRFAGDLPKDKYHCVYANMINQTNNPPEILAITKKK